MSFGITFTGVQQSGYKLQRGDVSQQTKAFIKAHFYYVHEHHLQQRQVQLV